MLITFELNGIQTTLDVPGSMRVIDLLREQCGLTGPKEGCGTGECGACSVWIDGRTKLSCLMVAAQIHGHSVTTIEGMGTAEHPHPLQTAFARKGAVQCGYCTPGMIMTGAELLRTTPNPNRDQIKEAISGNLCRCTGYQKIVEAFEDASFHVTQNKKRHTADSCCNQGNPCGTQPYGENARRKDTGREHVCVGAARKKDARKEDARKEDAPREDAGQENEK